jgi:hypothetical protein
MLHICTMVAAHGLLHALWDMKLAFADSIHPVTNPLRLAKFRQPWPMVYRLSPGPVCQPHACCATRPHALQGIGCESNHVSSNLPSLRSHQHTHCPVRDSLCADSTLPGRCAALPPVHCHCMHRTAAGGQHDSLVPKPLRTAPGAALCAWL